MTVVAHRYLNALDQMAIGAVNLGSDTLKMGLLSSSYTPDLAANAFWGDIDADEISGTGYSTGGVTLGSITHTVTAAASWATTWATGVVTNVGDVIRPTVSNGFLYRASAAGTTGVSQPTWPTVFGETVVDNGVIWTNVGTGIFQFSSADASWAAATFSTRYGAIYDAQTGVAATEPLLVLVDFGGVQSPAAETFTATTPALGWWAETVG